MYLNRLVVYSILTQIITIALGISVQYSEEATKDYNIKIVSYIIISILNLIFFVLCGFVVFDKVKLVL